MPDFLQEDADTIHQRMLSKAPADISTIEGDFFWSSTRPTAEEKAELVQVKLQNILRLAFPQTSYGIYLEYLGEFKGIFKNSATKSNGTIKIIAAPGTDIEAGKIAATVATESKPSVEFEILESKTVDASGIAYVTAKCNETGIIGNVPAGSITVLSTPINGVQSIVNEEDFTGGTEIEDEEHFRERLMQAEQEEALSGADSDYVKWAKEVPGVGFAYPISEWNGPSTVKVLILDKNGQPATQQLIDDVQNYIAPIVPEGQNRGGKAPVGAKVTIATATILNINVQANFVFVEGFNTNDVILNLKNKLVAYISTIELNGGVVFNAIHSIIGSMIINKEGISDFSNLLINGAVSNIQLVDQVAAIGEVINAV